MAQNQNRTRFQPFSKFRQLVKYFLLSVGNHWIIIEQYLALRLNIKTEKIKKPVECPIVRDYAHYLSKNVPKRDTV